MPEPSLPDLPNEFTIKFQEGIATSKDQQAEMTSNVLYIDWTKNGLIKNGLCGYIKLLGESVPRVVSMTSRQLKVDNKEHLFFKAEEFDGHKEDIKAVFRKVWQDEQEKPKGTLGQIGKFNVSAITQETTVSDMYSYEEATKIKDPDHFNKITQATTGDAHGSVVKVLFKCLHDLGCQMEKEPWDQLMALCRTMPDDLDLYEKNKDEEVVYSPTLWNLNCQKMLEQLQQCLTLGLIEEGQYNSLKLLYEAVTTAMNKKPENDSAEIKKAIENLVIGNAEVTFPLFENLIKNELKNSVGKLWDESLSTAEKEKIKKKLGRFIGDVFGDRGPNDALTGIVFRQLKELGIPITLIIGNHDLELIMAFENFAQNEKALKGGNINDYQSGSLVRMDILCRANGGAGIAGVTYDNVRKLYDEVLVPQFKILDYSVGLKDGKEHLTLFSHAPTKPSIIWKAAYRLGMVPLKPLKQCNVKDFIKIIDFVNQEASIHLKAGNFVATLCERLVENNGQGMDAANNGDNPFDCFFWRRDVARDEDALLSTALVGYTCVSGHESETRKGSDIDLDNAVLKGKNANKNQNFNVWASSDAHSRPLSDTKVEGIDYKEALLRNATLFVNKLAEVGEISVELQRQKEAGASYDGIEPSMGMGSIKKFLLNSPQDLITFYQNRTKEGIHLSSRAELTKIDPTQEVVSNAIKNIVESIGKLYCLAVPGKKLNDLQKKQIIALLTYGKDTKIYVAGSDTYLSKVSEDILMPIITFMNKLLTNNSGYNDYYNKIAEINEKVKGLGYTDMTMPLWSGLKVDNSSIFEKSDGDVVIEEDDDPTEPTIIADKAKGMIKIQSKMRQAIIVHSFTKGLLNNVRKNKVEIEDSIRKTISSDSKEVKLVPVLAEDRKAIDHYTLKIPPQVANVDSTNSDDTHAVSSVQSEPHTILEIYEKRISVPENWTEGFPKEKTQENITKMAKIALDTYIKTSGAESGEGKKTIRLSGSDVELHREIERLIGLKPDLISVNDHDKYENKNGEKVLYSQYLNVAPSTLSRSMKMFQRGERKLNKNNVHENSHENLNSNNISKLF